jgi:hypothetical protein
LASHPDLASEQAYIDHAYDCLERARESATRLRSMVEVGQGGTEQARWEREMIEGNIANRLDYLNVGDASLVFGRVDRARSEGGDTYYIGRIAVADERQEPVVVDWRAPIAEPFYRATGRAPMGLVRRRHFATRGRQLLGIEDELFGEASGILGGELRVVDEGTEIRGTGALIAALEQGIDPDTKYVSEEKEYEVDVGTGKPETWRVQNYDGIERGEISLQEALWQSDNTVFADLAMNAGGRGLKDGPEEIADVAKRCGITTRLPVHPKPSIVLGAYEVSPLDMASAYATIANHGRRVEPTAITKVVSHEEENDEKVLYVAPEHTDGEQVVSEDVANEAIGIMVGDVTEGIAKDASLGDRPVAGKTGTSENFFDAWFIGFTPELVTGTWMGYAEGGQTLEYVLDYARKLH